MGKTLSAGRQRATRRGLLRIAAAGAGGSLVASCTARWPRVDPGGGRIVALPTATPVRFGWPRLRLVVAQEGLPVFDRALSQVLAEAAGQSGVTLQIQDVAAFTRLPPRAANGQGAGGEAAMDTVAHQLLVAVQAGVPPDALLLLGRQAQTARFQAMGLAQDVSGLVRQARRRFGGTPLVTEQMHMVAGSWFAVPHYQRLIGHWIHEGAFRAVGIDPLAAIDSVAALRGALTQLREARGRAAPEPDFWGWGIGAADTTDADAWCWGVIYAWDGALADRQGQRVTLAAPETVAALEWLAATLGEPPWRQNVPPQAATWADAEKNAAFLAGATAYTFTEQALAGAGEGADVRYLPAPAGPAARLRAIGGGAAWLLPRGGAPEPVQRLLEALLVPAAQGRLWSAGEGFALPAYNAGWDDALWKGLPHPENARRFREELTNGGFASATGNGGPETAAAQAIGEARLGVGMLRAALAGRSARDAAAETAQRAVQIFRDYGLAGA